MSFQRFRAVKEDVAEIILNIKNLTCRMNGDDTKVLVIDAEGECTVTAESIKCDSEVEILNPELHIATLAEGAKLYMEIYIDRGRGYIQGDRNRPGLQKDIVGLLPVDSIYTAYRQGQLYGGNIPCRRHHQL